MKSEEFINKIVTVTMDRPLGTKHPKHGFIYELNYGYIPNTVSGDGEELDCYMISILMEDALEEENLELIDKNNKFVRRKVNNK